MRWQIPVPWQSCREVYNWRNRENHYAYEIESERLPDSLHGAVALYLFAAMVNAEKFNYIEG